LDSRMISGMEKEVELVPWNCAYVGMPMGVCCACDLTGKYLRIPACNEPVESPAEQHSLLAKGPHPCR
jgi:hypothetical protein